MNRNIILIPPSIANAISPRLSNGLKDLLGVASQLHVSSTDKLWIVLPSFESIDEPSINKIHNLCSLAEDTSINILNLIHSSFKFFNPSLLIRSVLDTIETQNNFIFCTLNTPMGCQMAAKLTIDLGISILPSIEKITTESDCFLFHRSLMNGKWVSHLSPLNDSYVICANSGAFADFVHPEGTLTIDQIKTRQISLNDTSFQPVEIIEANQVDQALNTADVVIAGGRGLKNSENVDLIEKTVKMFKNAAIGSSRPACDLGWFPFSKQIGETGHQVAPKLYLACGISGAQQHLAGMKNSQMIIAINTDPNAAIFSVADFGVVAKLEELLPILIECWKEDTP